MSQMERAERLGDKELARLLEEDRRRELEIEREMEEIRRKLAAGKSAPRTIGLRNRKST